MLVKIVIKMSLEENYFAQLSLLDSGKVYKPKALK